MRKVWIAFAVATTLMTFSFAAYADTTVKSPDGGLEIALPNGWHEVKPEGAATKIAAVDNRGSRVVVRVFPKEDFKDIKAVAHFVVDKLKLSDDDSAKTEEIQVSGKPGLRTTVIGTQSSGMRAGFVITVFESENMYVDVMGRAEASVFSKQAPVFAAFATQLKVTPTAPGSKPPAKP